MSGNTPDDEDDSPFTKCDACGSIRVEGSAHSCSTAPTTSGRTRECREELISEDDRDPDDDVAMLRGRTDSAYHEPYYVYDLDRMVAHLRTPPDCRSEPEKREFEIQSRDYAQRTGRYPCSYCYPDCHE
jgi:hypothetical protein